MRVVLVVGEVALAFVLLVGAGLMVSTFQQIAKVNLGYDQRNVLAANISLSGSEYETPSRISTFYQRVLAALNEAQDVEAAAAVGDASRATAVLIQGRPVSRPGEPNPEIHTATSQYLRAIRLPLLEGRWISEQDGPDANRSVVLSASVVRHYWPGSSPLGQRIKLGNTDSPWLTVVGVVGDVNDWFMNRPLPAAYVSYRQFPQASMELRLRSLHDSRDLAHIMRETLKSIDRQQPAYNVQTLEQRTADETSGIRNSARLMGVYAAIALVLAVTGIYSVSSFFVTQRTREIGVRMSLGATRPSIVRMVLSQSCVTAGLGLLIGVPAAILLATGMSRALYNIVAVQPLAFIFFIIVLGGGAIIAGFLPSYRAAKIDPVEALRHE
jgi:putative ABC transport system permease protein